VAALPSPSRLAETFAEIAASVSASREALGSRHRSSGRNARAILSVSPHWRMTSMTPDHRHSIPAMERQKETAFCAPVSAAADTASSRPPAAPKRSESRTIPHQTTVIAIKNLLLRMKIEQKTEKCEFFAKKCK
jgi:hypothetical protein